MQRLVCEVCGGRADLHETCVEEGKVVTRHLCNQHGGSAWREALPAACRPGAMEAAAKEFAERLSGLTDEEWAHLELTHRLKRRRL